MVESVQRRYTKRIPALSHLSYEQRLAFLDLKSLEYRRLVTDLTMAYKILHGKVNIPVETCFKIRKSDRSLRSSEHPILLDIVRSRTNIRKYYFSNRIVKCWNSLPPNVVMSPSVNSFKINLSKIYLSAHLMKRWAVALRAL